MAALSVTLPESLREWAEGRVRDGEYADLAEYVHDLIRHDRDRRKELLAALDEGEASGISPRSVDTILIDTKAKLKSGAL